jgi:endonuclease/exonuclease/phosphatase family metal-dependent hydrolase
MNVSFLQWNIWYDEDIENIARDLKANKADIICLQELSNNNHVQSHVNGGEYLAKELGYNYYEKELQTYEVDGKTVITANGIFTKFPIKKSHYVWVNEPTGVGGFEDEHRAYLESELDINGSTLTVGTVHMSYTHAFKVSSRKQQETDKLVAELARHKNNFIFSGDLNAEPNSYVIKKVESALTHVGPDYVKKSWTTKPFSHNGFEEDKLSWRLDYVFATPDIKVSSTEIEKSKFSDHLPIRVEFEF